MVQDPLESLSKSFHTVRYSCQINASVPAIVKWQKTHRALSRFLFVPSTTGKKHGLSRLLRVRGSHMAACRESPNHCP